MLEVRARDDRAREAEQITVRRKLVDNQRTFLGQVVIIHFSYDNSKDDTYKGKYNRDAFA